MKKKITIILTITLILVFNISSVYAYDKTIFTNAKVPVLAYQYNIYYYEVISGTTQCYRIISSEKPLEYDSDYSYNQVGFWNSVNTQNKAILYYSLSDGIWSGKVLLTIDNKQTCWCPYKPIIYFKSNYNVIDKDTGLIAFTSDNPVIILPSIPLKGDIFDVNVADDFYANLNGFTYLIPVILKYTVVFALSITFIIILLVWVIKKIQGAF